MPQDKWSKYLVKEEQVGKWDKYAVAQPSATATTTFPPKKETRSLEDVLKSLTAPLNYASATNPTGNLATPQQVASDVRSVGEVGLPFLAQGVQNPILRSIATGALQGTGTLVGKTLEDVAAGKKVNLGENFAQAGISAGIGTGAQGFGEALALAAKPAFQKTANELSQVAYKIPPSIKTQQRDVILGTSQKYGITPTRKGIERLDTKLSELTTVQKGLEQQAMQGGVQSVKTTDLVANIDALVDKWKKSDTPLDFINVIEKYKANVLRQQKPELGIQEMIDLKRNLQNQLSSVYEKQMKINPTIRQTLLQEAKQNLEKSVREKLEAIIPEYKDVNSEIHKMLKLKEYVQQAANRISNVDLLKPRWQDFMFGGLGYAAKEDPTIAVTAAVLGRVLTDPRTQAYLANKLSQIPAKAISTGIGTVGRVGTLPLQEN